MPVGRHEKYRVPDMNFGDGIARAVAFSNTVADFLFVPFISNHGAVEELVTAVAPKPVSVVVHRYEDNSRAFAELGVRCCSVGVSLAKATRTAFDEAATTLREIER